MRKLRKELEIGAQDNERVAINESICSIKKAQDSSQMAIGIFDSVSPEYAFISSELTHALMVRMREQSIQTIAEIQDNNKAINDQKILATEIILHIKDIIQSTYISIASIIENSPKKQ